LIILIKSSIAMLSTEVVMARSLGALDWIVIAALVILAAIVIYLLSPLVIVIAIAAVAYLIYRWYTGRSVIRVS
jgi:hypothetical protein